MKNVKLNEKAIEYFELMIDDFCSGNDNNYGAGNEVSFLFEGDEKTDLDCYDEEDVNDFIEVREFIRNEGGEIKYMGMFGDEDLEYTFKVIEDDIKCSFLEPEWE